ncbi:GntR family transcriptional regulator [Ramlibacter sp. AW1]|uniref:GntR family transcriptional regulator n=1 Tax=Ramlibacter aurantiacus TaxID=2801330 RepID=A0A936ZHE8_9BURK|nr:GntR family transcriptional regulator [Ramlibacter aurantiacus]MBL0420298.1 GntR family transcriptional regulator [Ramlibacter aurantiacus]
MLDLNRIDRDRKAPTSEPEEDPSPAGAAQRKNAGGDIHRVHSLLRRRIIFGEIAPGEVLNQVHLARDLGVSRTPVREAFRLLQAENLVETNHQHRVRVTAITPADVDSVYATWIVVQALGTALTVPRITPSEMRAIRRTLDELETHTPPGTASSTEWDDSHVHFHRALVMHAGPMILETIDSCWSRSERARRTCISASLHSYGASHEEHAGLVDAYAQGDVAKAIFLSSRQLARVARIVIGNIDPGYEPVAVRDALKMATSNAPEPKLPSGRRT